MSMCVPTGTAYTHEHIDGQLTPAIFDVALEDQADLLEHAARGQVVPHRAAYHALALEASARKVAHCSRRFGRVALAPVLLEEAIPKVILTRLRQVLDAAPTDEVTDTLFDAGPATEPMRVLRKHALA
jgi:hypothetical protein